MTTWKKIAVNAQNVEFIGRGVKIFMPHSSDYDRYVVWLPASLARTGNHAYEYMVSVADDMKLSAKRYGQGRYNKFDIIDERPISVEDFIDAFGGEAEYKKKKSPESRFKKLDIPQDITIHDSLRD